MMNERKKRILHVEDDLDLQNYIVAIFSNIADITAVQSLKEARTLLRDNQFDLLLVDFTLPDGSGSELIIELSANHSSMPIVVFSAHEISDTMLNVSDVFVKGRFKEQDLINSVQTLCSQQQSQSNDS